MQFKVTFIYRKFINSYTDKFIILERDIYICLNIYIYISNSYLNSCWPNSLYFDISLFV